MDELPDRFQCPQCHRWYVYRGPRDHLRHLLRHWHNPYEDLDVALKEDFAWTVFTLVFGMLIAVGLIWIFYRVFG